MQITAFGTLSHARRVTIFRTPCFQGLAQSHSQTLLPYSAHVGFFSATSACLRLSAAIAQVSRWSMHNQAMVLHHQNDDSAVYAAFPRRFTPETTNLTYGLDCFSHFAIGMGTSLPIPRSLNQPSLEDPIHAKSLRHSPI